MVVDGDGARPSAARGQQQQPATAPARDPAAPQVERVLGLVGGGRYVLFSVAATAIAVASTYQKAPTIVDADGSVVSAWLAFREELLRSRLNMAIVLHFYFVVLYHVFLAVTHVCFDSIRRAELQVSIQTKETILHFLLMRSLLLASTLGGGSNSSGSAGFSSTIDGDTDQTAVRAGRPPVVWLLIWLSVLAFLRGILSICSARFEHLLTRPMTRPTEFHRLAFTLLAIIVVNGLVAAASTHSGGVFSTTVVHLTWFEAALFVVKAAQLGTKVVFHLFDVGHLADHGIDTGEYGLLVLQTGLSGTYLVLLVSYYLYIISVDHFRVSFMDFILILNVKNATVELLEKVKQVQMYHQVVVELDALFPDATQGELDAVQDDVCVICLKPMENQVKKLECGHLFHRVCLRQCLQPGFLARWLPVPDVYFEVARPAPTPFVVTDEMVLRVWEVFPQFSVDVIRPGGNRA
ncbi:hypothetical protein P43SY_009228 [Pythium insidiosum]|uniref:RING-type domain-containing protein n=1 Tax=Pythium insidiosum TaxID=114742 RepID=A0AAD5M5M4_PYTIN|nr:hypothetical protein P43SY_009228 [Pythium insidiosum]